jgi:hypothetical protein
MYTLTLASAEKSEDCINYNFSCDFTVTLAGDSLWDCKDTAVRVTHIAVMHYESGSTYINVTHTGTWRIYTDSAFEAAISKALGYAVGFTEQGMQEDGMASMEC